MKTTSRLRSPAARRAPFPGPGVAYCPAGFSACPQAPETDMIPVMLRLLAALLSLLTWLAGSPAQRAVPGQTALHITIYIARYRTGEDSDRSSSYQHRIRATDKTLTFGKRFTTSGGNPARRDPTFQQRTYDAGLGIYDYRNRSFDPATGRFLQRDPVLGGDELFNPYCFPGNNPVGNVDPFGDREWTSGDFKLMEKIRTRYGHEAAGYFSALVSDAAWGEMHSMEEFESRWRQYRYLTREQGMEGNSPKTRMYARLMDPELSFSDKAGTRLKLIGYNFADFFSFMFVDRQDTITGKYVREEITADDYVSASRMNLVTSEVTAVTVMLGGKGMGSLKLTGGKAIAGWTLFGTAEGLFHQAGTDVVYLSGGISPEEQGGAWYWRYGMSGTMGGLGGGGSAALGMGARKFLPKFLFRPVTWRKPLPFNFKGGRLGSLSPSNNKLDPDAVELARYLGDGAKPQVEFGGQVPEVDAVNWKYIGQSKAHAAYGSKFRNQAKFTFRAAKLTGREPYFRFGSADKAALAKLAEYSSRFGVGTYNVEVGGRMVVGSAPIRPVARTSVRALSPLVARRLFLDAEKKQR